MLLIGIVLLSCTNPVPQQKPSLLRRRLMEPRATEVGVDRDSDTDSDTDSDSDIESTDGGYENIPSSIGERVVRRRRQYAQRQRQWSRWRSQRTRFELSGDGQENARPRRELTPKRGPPLWR